MGSRIAIGRNRLGVRSRARLNLGDARQHRSVGTNRGARGVFERAIRLVSRKCHVRDLHVRLPSPTRCDVRDVGETLHGLIELAGALEQVDEPE